MRGLIEVPLGPSRVLRVQAVDRLLVLSTISGGLAFPADRLDAVLEAMRRVSR